MHLNKLVMAMCLMLAVSPAAAQKKSHALEALEYTARWQQTKDPEILRLTYAKWQDALRADRYFLQEGVDISQPSPTRRAFVKFCSLAYEDLLKYSPAEGMKCAKLLGKRKEAEYRLTRVRQQAVEQAAKNAQEAQVANWLHQLIEQAKQTGCEKAVSHYKGYLAKLEEINPESAKDVYQQGQKEIAHCEEDKKRFEKKLALAEQEYQTLASKGYLNDAANAAMAIDDLNRQGFSVEDAKTNVLLELETCVTASVSDGEKKQAAIMALRRKAALEGAKARRELEAQLQEVEDELIDVLGQAQDAERQAKEALEAAQNPEAAKTALAEAERKRQKAEEDLAAVRNTDPVSTTKKWSELGSECQEAVQLASKTRQFCINNEALIRRTNNVLEERCLLFIGAREQAKIVDTLQSLHGLRLYVETNFSKPRDKANLDEQNFIKEAILRELNPMIEAYGGTVRSSADIYLTISVVVSSAGRDLAKRRVSLKAWRWERNRAGKRFMKTLWQDYRQVNEEKGLNTTVAALITRDLSRVLFSALVAHLTKESYH